MDLLLDDIAHVDDLLELPYFDFLACMGQFPLHPRGAAGTRDLIRAGRVGVGEHILDIGCGTGWTTRLLLQAGARVTLFDKSERMITAAQRACREAGFSEPNAFLGDAQNLAEVLGGAKFDFILCECVLGFVDDKETFVADCARVLKPGGRIGINDFHYQTTPPLELQNQLQQAVGVPIEPLSEADWRGLFKAFDTVSWQCYETPAVPPPSVDAIRKSLELAGLTARMPWLDQSGLEACARRWAAWENVFQDNRAYLRNHIGVWKASLA